MSTASKQSSANNVEAVDLLVVGSGPAGTSTALHLVDLDSTWARRLLVVDKAVHPREKLCGGGITHMGEVILKRLGLAFEPANFPVREVRLTYQDQAYSFFGNPVLRIVHRAEFDHWLLQQAEARGIEVRQGEGVQNVSVREDYVEVITDRQIYHAQAVVAADGSRSTVRQKLKWDDASRVARLIEVLTPEDERTAWEFRDGVAVFDFTRMTAGLQGYYWDFPSIVRGRKQMNRGVFDSRARPERPKVDLVQTLRDSLAERERALDDYTLKGHPIRWFDPHGRFAIPRVLLAGDAAGADPLFGEGISPALAYGQVAAQTVHAAFGRNDLSFADYKARILENWVLRSVAIRVRLARSAYLLKYPWLVRLGWRVARGLIGFTAWRDPEFVPAESARLAAGNRALW